MFNKTAEQRTICTAIWYTGCWWVGCYVWYTELGEAAAHPGPSSLYQM